jgi:hypothetical protein
LHQVFKWETGTRRFLAGRQFAVVIIIFLVSRLATFSGGTWPFTHEVMPRLLSLICYTYGVAGALFTLWWGQLLPQFLAAKRPLWFGNLQLSTGAFVFGNVVESLGITTPADWAAKFDSSPAEAEIPISPAHRYRQAATTLEGRGHLGVTKTWEITRKGARATHTLYTRVAADNIESLSTQGPLIGETRPTKLVATQVLLRNGVDTDLSCEFQSDVRLSDFEAPTALATPTVGWFHPGDILHTEFTLEGKDPGDDTIPILGPTKHLLFRVALTDPPRSFPGVAVTVSRLGQNVGDDGDDAAKGKIFARWISAKSSADGAAVAEAYFPFPDVGAVYKFHWTIEW